MAIAAIIPGMLTGTIIDTVDGMENMLATIIIIMTDRIIIGTSIPIVVMRPELTTGPIPGITTKATDPVHRLWLEA